MFFTLKFPWIPQHDSMQCGLACMAMVCKYYGVQISLDELEEVCGSQVYGCNIHTLSRLSEDLGFDSMAVRIDLPKLDHVTLPVILYWNQNHFVVLYKITSNRGRKYFYISDPAQGKYKLNEEKFIAHWSVKDKGVLLLIEPSESVYSSMALESDTHGKGRFNKPSKIRDALNLISLHGEKEQLAHVKILGLLFLIAIIQLALPFLTQFMVDKGIHEKNIGFVWLILIGELVLVIGRTIADFVRRWITLKVSMRVSLALLKEFIDKLFRLPMRYLMTRRFGDLRQRFEDHGRVQNFLTSELVGVSFAIISFCVFSIVLWYYNALLLGVLWLFSILYVGWLALFLSIRKKLDYERFEAASKNNSYTYQLLTSIPDIKIHSCTELRRMEWEESMKALFANQTKLLRMSQVQDGGSVLIMELKNIFLTVLSASFVINGAMSLGEMLAIQYIIGQLSVPIETIMRSIYSWQDMNISFQRINEIHECDDESNLYGKMIDIPKMKDIVLSGLSFSYEKYAPCKTLDNINLVIPAGKITAIVGGSGTGKSTLIKILLGYFPDVNSRIMIGKHTLSELNIDSWREKCGVVLQDGVIFSDTIERNIVMDDSEIDGERFKSSIEISCLSEYVDQLPLGYNTLIGRDGKALSQGQKQRILIARAVYKNPEVIIFDEATNSLDAALEHRIVENLNNFFKNRTVIIVAHRLSTIRHADKILVMDKGHIVEEGTHDILMAAGRHYCNLVKHQTG